MYVDLALHDDAEIIGRICNDKKCAEIQTTEEAINQEVAHDTLEGNVTCETAFDTLEVKAYEDIGGDAILELGETYVPGSSQNSGFQ